MQLDTKIKKIARVVDGGNVGLAGIILDLEEKIDSLTDRVDNIKIPKEKEDRTDEVLEKLQDEEIIVEVNIV